MPRRNPHHSFQRHAVGLSEVYEPVVKIRTPVDVRVVQGEKFLHSAALLEVRRAELKGVVTNGVELGFGRIHLHENGGTSPVTRIRSNNDAALRVVGSEDMVLRIRENVLKELERALVSVSPLPLSVGL